MDVHGVVPPDDEDLRRVVASIMESEKQEFLLLELDGVAAGMCQMIYSFSSWLAAEVAELQDVVVAAPYRGRGLGRSLIAAARARAAERGCRTVFLVAEAWNLPAHGFYRRLDFKDKTSLYFETTPAVQDESPSTRQGAGENSP